MFTVTYEQLRPYRGSPKGGGQIFDRTFALKLKFVCALNW